MRRFGPKDICDALQWAGLGEGPQRGWRGEGESSQN